MIVAAVTVLLIYGIRESAKTNTMIVIIKVAVVVFFISFGAFMVHPTNWHPYVPNGFPGLMSGAAIIFFAFIGFDAVSTTAEETKNPRRDMPIGIIASLIICTLLYVLMGTFLPALKNIRFILGDPAAAATAFASKPWAEALISAGALAGMTSVLLVFQLGQPRIFMAMARDGLLPQYFAQNSSALPHPARDDNLDRRDRRRSGDAGRHRFTRRSDEHRNIVRVHSCLRRCGRFAADRRRASAAVSCPARAAVSDHRRDPVLGCSC